MMLTKIRDAWHRLAQQLEIEPPPPPDPPRVLETCSETRGHQLVVHDTVKRERRCVCGRRRVAV